MAGELYECLLFVIWKVGECELWEVVGIFVNVVEVVDYFLRCEWGNYLVGCFDFVGGLDDVFLKMLEFNGDIFLFMFEIFSV